MKFGVFSVSMPEYNVEETVQLLADLGYDGVEWRVTNPPPAEKPANYDFGTRYWSYNRSTLDISDIAGEAKRAKELCDKHGIEIFSLTTYLRPDQPAEIEPVLQAAQSIGCPMIRVFTKGYDETENFNTLFNDTLEQTKVLEALAKKYGVKIVYEIHMNNILSSPSAAQRLVCGFDPDCIGVIFDPGNMVQEGFESYKKSVEMLGKHLAHVHIKNCIWEQAGVNEDGSAKWQVKWVPVPDGIADLRKLFTVLKEAGYEGKASVEDFSNVLETREKLEAALTYLKKLPV